MPTASGRKVARCPVNGVMYLVSYGRSEDVRCGEDGDGGDRGGYGGNRDHVDSGDDDCTGGNGWCKDDAGF